MKKRFLLVGNRTYIYDYLTNNRYNLEVVAFKNSYLHKKLLANKIQHLTFSNKLELNKILSQKKFFDILISNGCPFKITEHVLSLHKQKILINIHPSFLPQLRGADPQVGSILFRIDSGVTCHLISNKIDQGDIISQYKIPYSDDLDIELLYQIGFRLEVEVLKKAIELKFASKKKQKLKKKHIYYTFSKSDLLLDFSKNPEDISKQLKAFKNRKEGLVCRLKKNKKIKFKIIQAEPMYNSFILDNYNYGKEGEIIIIYSEHVIIKSGRGLLKIKLDKNQQLLKLGDILIG